MTTYVIKNKNTGLTVNFLRDDDSLPLKFEEYDAAKLFAEKSGIGAFEVLEYVSPDVPKLLIEG